ncbi:ABC transporter substrate-binding protein [Nocardioides sp.]|uniref:ABC transporter substrate-binding protein n=1 Tax=Nocardioides sp. TaxID=35761 RepID=UPI0039E49C0E
MSALLRRSAGALLATLLLLVIAGCDGSSDSGEAGGSGGSSGAASQSGTRTVTDVEGTDVEVPASPQRVVALSEPTLDGVLALGVTPVGTITGRGQSTVPHYLIGQAGDIPILGGVAQPSYEAIAAAEPDLILVDGTSLNNNPDAMAILREIAPTVYTGYAGGDWKVNFGFVADALNLADQAKQVVADYEAKAAAAKEQLAATYGAKTFSIVRWQGGSASLILKELPAGMALADVGLARPPAQDRRGRGHSEPVSLENLAQIDADYIFFGTLGGSSNDNPAAGGSSDEQGAEKALAAAEKVAGFTSLTAYQEGHIIPVDGSLWTSTGGPLLMSGLIDSILEALS